VALLEVLLRTRSAARRVGGAPSTRPARRPRQGIRCRNAPSSSPRTRVVLEVARGRDDHVGRDVGAAEVVAQRRAVNDSTVSGVPRIGRPERVPSQKCCVKSSWTRSSGVSSTILISSRITFFSRSMSSARTPGAARCRPAVDGERQVLVEHLDVVAGVLLRREGVELPADRVDRLRDVLGRPVAVPLKSMCSTKCAMPLRSSARGASRASATRRRSPSGRAASPR
jgi:hypothetical protein